MPRPKPAEEPVQVVLRISPTLLARVDAEAAASKRSRNGVISDAIVFHVADRHGRRIQVERHTAEAAEMAERIGLSDRVQIGPAPSEPRVAAVLAPAKPLPKPPAVSGGVQLGPSPFKARLKDK